MRETGIGQQGLGIKEELIMNEKFIKRKLNTFKDINWVKKVTLIFCVSTPSVGRCFVLFVFCHWFWWTRNYEEEKEYTDDRMEGLKNSTAGWLGVNIQ